SRKTFGTNPSPLNRPTNQTIASGPKPRSEPPRRRCPYLLSQGRRLWPGSPQVKIQENTCDLITGRRRYFARTDLKLLFDLVKGFIETGPNFWRRPELE